MTVNVTVSDVSPAKVISSSSSFTSFNSSVMVPVISTPAVLVTFTVTVTDPPSVTDSGSTVRSLNSNSPGGGVTGEGNVV